MHRQSRVIILALVLASSACHRTAPAETEMTFEADQVLTIKVANHAQLDATIYLAHDGVRDRLGTVSAAATATFSVRARRLGSGEFVLLADPLGSRRIATSERLIAALGTLFIWTLESDFEHNSVLVQD